MSHANLSRRAILAGAASVPALARPTVALAEVTPPKLLAPADQLKPIWAAVLDLDPKVREAYEPCSEASHECHEKNMGQPEASRRFDAMSKRTGYGRLMDRLNVLDGKQRRLARAILKIELN